MLAALKFNVSMSTKFSLYYVFDNRDVGLPLDNILNPRSFYYEDEHHNIGLLEPYRAFTLVRNNLKNPMKQEKKCPNISTNDIDFKIGDLVSYRYHNK